jgi:hypothetical protein
MPFGLLGNSRFTLYLRGGDAWSVALTEGTAEGLEVTAPFDVNTFLTDDPEWLASVVISRKIEIPEQGGSLFVGEGGWGSEGIFGTLDGKGNLMWVVYLGESNPFINAEISGSDAIFSSSSGVRIYARLGGTPFTLPGPGA